MKVAVPVASATGRKVRTLTSGIISSMANITPPMGVLKVAAMPAPAPAATSVMRCHGSIGRIWPTVEPNEAPIWMIGTLAADRGAGADGERRGQRFHRRDHRADFAVVVEDRVHHFGHAVAARFGREFGRPGTPRPCRRSPAPGSPVPPRARRRVDIGVVDDREVAEEEDVVDQADQGAEEDRADAGDDAHHDRDERQSTTGRSTSAQESMSAWRRHSRRGAHPKARIFLAFLAMPIQMAKGRPRWRAALPLPICGPLRRPRMDASLATRRGPHAR